MRRFLPVALSCLLLLGSCAGVPRPENDQSTLVIGSFILDYPDGLFEYNARTIPVGVYVTVRNNTKDSTFDLRTNDGGYFYFLSNGSDSYSLVRYSYSFTASGIKTYSMEGEIGGTFTAAPGQVCYLGHIVFHHTRPKLAEVSMQSRTRNESWQYDLKATRDDTPDRAIDFLRKLDPDSPWPSRTVVTAHME